MQRIIYLVLVLVVAWSNRSVAESPVSFDASNLTETELRIALRDLWTGHVFWVRSVVVSAHYRDDAGLKASETQTVENARALADAIVPFYGQEAADKLFGLLAGHYGAIKGYLDAGLAKNKSGQESAVAGLTQNATAIAEFLDAANPHLPKTAVLPLLLAHGGHHVQQIDLFAKRDMESEARVWEQMLGHVHGIADAMAGALKKQFPSKVAG